MKIGIVTLHGSKNYGAVLQCYALQQALKSLGHDVHVVHREWGRFRCINRKEYIRIALSNIKNRIIPEPFAHFRRRRLHMTPKVKSMEQLDKIQSCFDALVVGSDQVWNFDCIEEMGLYYYLDWGKDVKRYSYAASFGKESFQLPQQTIDAVAQAIRKFNGISVRESSGIEICKSYLKTDALQHIDPTCLHDKDFYINMLLHNTHILQKNSVCIYFLDRNDDKLKLAQKVAHQEQCTITDNLPPLSGIKKYFSRQHSIEKWLMNIAESKVVITDSFHGMIFAIIFEKPFIVYRNKERGAARFESMLGLLGLEDRIIDNFAEYSSNRMNAINYHTVTHIINIERAKAISYLKRIN